MTHESNRDESNSKIVETKESQKSSDTTASQALYEAAYSKTVSSTTTDLSKSERSASSLPQLTLHDPDTNVKDDKSTLKDSPSHSPAADGSGERSKWTVVADLGMSVVDAGVKDGSDKQLAELKELAEKTRGTGVTVLAQQLRAGEGADKGTVDRYLIKDGKITQLKSEASQGYAQDMKGLLQLAGKEAPSDKIALVSQTHGLGADGVVSDNGKSSLDELKAAIKDGLAGSGHEQLDLVDFDACVMGSQSVEDKFHDVAKQIVASEEVEAGSGDSFDCQSLKTVVQDLLKSPDMTAGQLADEFVDAARRGDNGAPTKDTGYHGGTDTLAHFDSSKYGQFKESLDKFAQALSPVLADSETKSKLESLIGATPTFPEGHTSNVDGERDLKTFAEKVLQAARDGTLPDPNHVIEKSAEDLLKAEKELTPSFYGEARTDRGYDQMGGLSVYLPRGGKDGVQAQAQHAIDSELSSSISQLGQSKDETLFMAKMRLQEFSSLSAGAREQLTGVEAAEHALESAGTDKDFQKAVQEFDKAMIDLKGTSVERELIDQSGSALTRSRAQELALHAPESGAWRDFVDMLEN